MDGACRKAGGGGGAMSAMCGMTGMTGTTNAATRITAGTAMMEAAMDMAARIARQARLKKGIVDSHTLPGRTARQCVSGRKNGARNDIYFQ